MNNYKEYNKKTLKHLQKVELMILKDFIKICDENNLNYFLYGGTLLGAIRHKGFIPWDDDLDVIMFRKDYEKFLKIMENNEINDKYEILDIRYNEDYFFNFGKMILNNTKLHSVDYSQIKFNKGIFIDIFILDNLPKNKIKQYFFRTNFFLMDRILTMSAIKITNFPPYTKILAVLHDILKKLKLKPKYFQKKTSKLLKKYGNKDTNYFVELTIKKHHAYTINDFTPPPL